MTDNQTPYENVDETSRRGRSRAGKAAAKAEKKAAKAAEKTEAPKGLARHGRLKLQSKGSALGGLFVKGLAVVLGATVAIGGYTFWDLSSSLQANGISLANAKPVTAADLEGPINMLLVGSDTRAGQGGGYGNETSNLADVIILLHVSRDRKNAVALSFPRDLMVPWPACPSTSGGPGYLPQSLGQINATISNGGPGCTLMTVEKLTGLTIPYLAMVDFKGVIEMSNAIGGVEVCVAKEISDKYTHTYLSPGMHTLQGKPALQFLRTRHGVGDGSDLGRISNQQVFLTSLIRKVKSAGVLTNPVRLYSLASAAARNTMQTNGGPITMWSNSDFSGTGAILLGNFTRLLSNGGAITMAGSASASETSPTGYARNNATVFPNGVELGTSNVASNVEINSSGGDITIRGYSNSNVNLTMGVKGWAGNTITAGTGSITVDGQVDGATGAITLHGTEFGFNGGATTSITSTKTSGTAISISGNSVGGTSSDTTGFTLWNPVTINASGGGDIVLNASSASANTPAAMRITGATILGKGAITFNGGKRIIFGANNVGTANTIGASTLATDAPGNVTVSSDFVEFINVVTTFRNSGNLVIEPASASFSAAQTLPATQFVETGVNGLRWGKSGNTAALTVSTALTAAGNIELYGGATTVSSAITSTGGTILSNASTFSNTATLTTTGRNISVFADQATIGAALTTGSTSGGIVTLSPSSVARNVDLGAADTASLLGLTDAELDFVTAQTLRVGSSSFANNVNISGAISIASNRVTNLAVRAAGDITTSGSGSLALNLGAILAAMAAAMGLAVQGLSDAAAADAFVQALRQLNTDLNIPNSLQGFGIAASDIDGLVEGASKVTRLLDNNPRTMAREDMRRIYADLL